MYLFGAREKVNPTALIIYFKSLLQHAEPPGARPQAQTLPPTATAAPPPTTTAEGTGRRGGLLRDNQAATG